MSCVPMVRAESVRVATPFARMYPDPMVVPESVKMTEPEGVPEEADTVAVSVTVSLSAIGSAEKLTTIVAISCPVARKLTDDLLNANFASPE